MNHPSSCVAGWCAGGKGLRINCDIKKLLDFLGTTTLDITPFETLYNHGLILFGKTVC